MENDVTVERVNAPTKDLNVKIGRHAIAVQVKSGRLATSVDFKRKPENNRWVWRAGKKCADIDDPNHWYAFVYLGEWPKRGDAPRVFFVPAELVVETLADKADTGGEWFWMLKSEAEQFCGVKGFRKMKHEIGAR